VNPTRLLTRIVGGAVTNVDFADLVSLINALGFDEIGGKGSHRVFAHAGVAELLNLQEVRGQAKPYQVRQVVALVRRYDLRLESE
jgi:hypothetical protein